MPETLSVFEHEKLRIGERGFKRAHFDRLLLWNEANGFKYFDAGHKAIKFSQYVGVIQVGDLVIQVLPKADRNEDTVKWQRALVEMLRVVHDLPLSSTTDTHLDKRNTSILDLFFDLYVKDVAGLVRRGLVKQYHQHTSNQLALKGRIHWPAQLSENLIRKERFHVTHQVYDPDHLLHTLLKEALDIVKHSARDPIIRGGAQDLDWAFENVKGRTLNASTLERIHLGRKTQPYARSVQLAKMIVAAHAPDISGGRLPLIGLMFDMNVLYEKVVLRLLKRAAAVTAPEFSIQGQDKRMFWQNQRIKPDIVIRREERVELIIDTKWKVPKDNKPADADLKQMYAYNLQFGSVRSVLLYPGDPLEDTDHIDYELGHRTKEPHGCAVRFADLFEADGKLKKSWGGEMLQELQNEDGII